MANDLGDIYAVTLCVFLGITIIIYLVDASEIFTTIRHSLCGREKSSKLSALSDAEYARFLLSAQVYAGIPGDSCCGLKSGCWDDFIRYCVNQHTLLSMLLADPLHPYARKERLASFFVLNTFGFMLVCLTLNMDRRSSLITSIVIIAPVKLFMKTLLYYLLATPCNMDCKKNWRIIVDRFGHIVTGMLFALGFVWLFIAAYHIISASSELESRYAEYGVLWQYVYTVMVVANVEEGLLIYAKFVDSLQNPLWYTLNSLTCGIFSVGIWWRQKAADALESQMSY
jgi:hypothetical protein